MGTGRRGGRVGPRLSVRHRPQHHRADSGQCTLQVHFHADRAAANVQDQARALRFAGLLRLHPSLRVLVAMGSGGLTVAVRFSYHTELERARVYDHIVWLLELSGRATA